MNGAITAWRRIERDVVLHQRVRFINQIWDEYKKTLSPASWLSLPTPEQILRTEPFLSLHNSASNTPLDYTSCTEGISQLPIIVSRFRDNFRDQLERSLSAHRVGLNCSSSVELEDRVPMRSTLDLAMSVFTCYGCCERVRKTGMCLIGWDECKDHLSCPRTYAHGGMTPRHIGCDTASTLVRLLDLDPQTTTPEQMDGSHALFLCANCPIKKIRNIWGHKVYSWRECVRFTRTLSLLLCTEPYLPFYL